jgi:flagellar biosynthetic protein FliO
MAEIIIKIKKWFETSSKKQKLVVSLLAFSLLATGTLLSLGDTANPAKDPFGSTPFYFLSAFVKLMGVLLLIVGSSVIFRRWLQPGMNAKTTKQMRLLETIRLSPKQSLHLIVIGDQKLLIGATDQNVALIAPIDENLATAAVEESQPQPALDFGSMFRSFNVSSEKTQGKA